MKISALIPAAGSGERLGMGAKALLELHGKTLLERSVAAFLGIADEIIVALPEAHLHLPLKHARAVAGGSSRQGSVLNLLGAATGDVVLIHDAARPFLPKPVIERVLAGVVECGAATAALPVADTLVLEQAGFWGSLTDRNQMRAVQTPQGFKRELLLEAHAKAQAQGISATDDAGLVARLGLPVALAAGDERLFKVTRAGDWALALAFAPIWDANSSPAVKSP
ncbi:MAG: 2-C-methyl-D-erythritol 4-phosphate cytidylyltransferase [Deinococcales bacterium]